MTDQPRYHGAQKAADWKDWIQGQSHMLIEPKLDGYRLSAVIDADGLISFHCGKAEPPKWAENLGHIAAAIGELGLRNVMIDGEVMAKTWNETASLIRRKRSIMSADIRERICEEIQFHAFDFVPMDIPREQRRLPKRRKLVEVVPVPLVERRGTLEQVLHLSPKELRLVPQFEVHSVQKLMEIYDEFVDLEYEGAMAKVAESPYALDTRVDFWQKLKPMQTVELRVTGGIEGKGKNAKMLGAFTGTLIDGVTARCGGGFTDEMRERYWHNLPNLIGRVIEMKVQTGTVASARHAVFLRFRD